MNIKKAIFFMAISTLAFTFMNFFIKKLIHIPVFEIVLFRSLGSLLISAFLTYRLKIAFVANEKKLVMLRGVIGISSMTLFFMSLYYLSTGTAVSIRYIAPIFAAIFAIFILNEKVKLPQWAFFLISFCGVLVLKGLDTYINTIGLVLVLAAAVLSGFVYILLSKIGKRDHPLVIINYFMAIGVVFGGLLSITNWVRPEGIEWAWISSLGIFGFIGQYFMTKAFQEAETNVVAPFKYLEVLFTGLLGFFLLNERYTLWGIFGMVLIILGLILNVLYKSRQKKQNTS